MIHSTIPDVPADDLRSGALANLILAGVGKAGTTSLYWYLSQHPEVCRSSVKETRYFLPLSAVDCDVTGPLPPQETYASFFARCSGERYRMEATPHYFHGGEPLVQGIRHLLPSPRILIILREQTARAVSTYRFAQSMLLIPRDESFEQFVKRAISIHRRHDPQVTAIRAYWSIVAGGDYASHLSPWLDAFSDSELRVLFFDDLVAHPSLVTQDVCRWLGIDAECAAGFDYTVENQSVPYRLQSIQRMALALNGERMLRNHPRMKAPLRRLYYRVNGVPDKRIEVDASTLDILRGEFTKSNERLHGMLAGRGYRSFPDWVGSPESSGLRTLQV